MLNPIYYTIVIVSSALLGCGQDYPQSTIDPASGDFGAAIHSLYQTVFWWTMLILAVVWGVLGWVLFRYRARPGGPEPKRIHGHLGLEIGWTVGAAIIVVLITIPTIHTVFQTQREAGEDALVVEVIGHQWWWEFRYPEQDVVTANELHLPVGRQVDLRLWSADVIHSFWVPRLGGKRDLNPLVRKPDGSLAINRLTFTVDEAGTFMGQCAEFCGPAHSLMGLRVIAAPEPEFEEWVERMKTPVEPDSGSLAARGREVFMGATCVACHAIAGTNARGRLGPDLTRLGARTTIGAGLLENTRENLAAWITAPAEFKPGVKMPGVAEEGGGFPPTGLSSEQVEAVAAYLASLGR
ncbi:MAG: cytochrome c oxidase subunit II [Gemmatimonadetes bacterium]|uniref:Cytochrome c oxidase subunit 2 n=1 Tax=Candidatus Kutchimonas denitrificans TaxID=3056748 RepID=A0AAE4ZBQ4_9BACT|nr:cytochrome c oxidase subunit II [Gemmatimonadota bacterium]NIR76272.1 cytochrome c oxidase subunit II [Candidatus Kutchimonas denitrificans]NIS02295.1 cytochrome c oxidase subunit II [Gemmatimonadota bacterium]NIT68114.1 cytochrome c oxidase subunit II [Gemmatimonadota bacterium]NIU54338.1 cytochrome c oxidase subunit II [Gemmatimonadota bacterium]